MTSSGQLTHNIMNQQQSVYNPDGNARMYTVLTNVPLYTNNEIPQEQQIAYYNPPINLHSNNNTHVYSNSQQVTNSLIVDQLPATGLTTQQHQQDEQLHRATMPNSMLQYSFSHSNTDQQQALVSVHQTSNNIPVPHHTTMTNPTESSTPILVSSKRGRNDTSGVSETNVQQRPQYHQATRVFNSNNTPNKRLRGINNQRNDGSNMNRYQQNQLVHPNQNFIGTAKPFDQGDNGHQPSMAACRFAATRFPFAPYSVTFSQDVREKIVVDHLIKHASDNFNFEVKTIAYRKARSENNECRILIFVENSESFAFLYDQSNWPATLAGCQYSIKSPSIPPQLSLVLPVVSLQIDWEDFVGELKEKYPSIANIIRLKNRAQQPVRAVKLEFMSITLRNEILDAGVISIMHMKLKVVEYYSQANVLICSNCFGIGHFRKNCTQKDESTCRVCGEKCTNLKDHNCSGAPKCIHCGGPHAANDAKCKVIKDYRAALTRNLLSNVALTNAGNGNIRSTQASTRPLGPTTDHQSYATVAQAIPVISNANDAFLKKLDAIIAKVEEESAVTRRSLEAVREEMKTRYVQTEEKVETLESKINTMEKKFQDFAMRTLTTIQNVCTSLLDPQGSKSANWKSYWQEQIGTLTELRSSLSKHAE